MSIESLGTDSQTFSPSQSPASVTPFPEKPTGQWFGDVIEDLLEGAKVHRLSWPEDEVVFFKNDRLAIRRNGQEFDQWVIQRSDLENADDWIIT